MRRYEKVGIKIRWDGSRVYRIPKYPIIVEKDTDIIIISQETDYLDTLANTYYKDPTLWWVIALANNLGKGKMSVPAGLQLRIPTNIQLVLAEFERLNR